MTAGPADDRALAHAFVADLGAPVLDAGDHHHLTRVLRLRPGDRLTVSDGAGRWRACRLPADGPALEYDGAVEETPAPDPPITVAFALTKGDRPEWVVQKLTEAGVDRIVPFVAARSVVRWDAAKTARQAERFAVVAREAAMQCRRVRLPEVSPPVTFAQATVLPGATLADRAGAAPSLARPTVLVGPEGGWSDEERACGLRAVALAPLVLRAETAAVAAGVLLSALRDGLVAARGPNGL